MPAVLRQGGAGEAEGGGVVRTPEQLIRDTEPVVYESGQVWEAWNAVRHNLPVIARRAVQTFTAFNVDDIYTEVRVLLAAHKLSLIPRLLSVDYAAGTYDSGKSFIDARVVVAYDVVHAEDASSFTMVGAAEGRDSQDKGTNKALQQALKYCLIQSLMISTGEPDAEDDPDRGDEPVNEEATERIRMRTQLTNAARAVVFKLAGDDEAAAALQWPLVLDRAGVVLPITTEEQRDTVITAAHALYDEQETSDGD